jgi:hypothetical protein
MADTSFRRFYRRAAFVALPAPAPIDVAVLSTVIGALVLDHYPAGIFPFSIGDGVELEWAEYPLLGDFTLVDAAIAAFVGGATTAAPIIVVANAAVTTTSATPTSVIDVTTPALSAGTYQVIFSSQFRLTTTVAGEAARAIAIITASPAAAVQQLDHSGDAVVRCYNGAATLLRTAGQTIRVQLQIAEVGPGVATAEMTQARVTIDKIG